MEFLVSEELVREAEQNRIVTRSMAARMQRGRESAQYTPEGRHLTRGRSKRK